jgi:hypothetical protein
VCVPRTLNVPSPLSLITPAELLPSPQVMVAL